MIINDTGKYRSEYIKRHKDSSFYDKSIYLIAPHLDLDGVFDLVDDLIKNKPADKYIPQDILWKVFKKEVILAIDSSAESLHRHIDIIYDKLIVNFNIPESQLLIISGSEDIYDKIVSKAKEVNKQPCLFEHYYYYQDSANQMLHSQLGKNYKSPLTKKSHSHKYINLNNKWRWHRIALLTLLKGDNFLDLGLNSFNKVRNIYNIQGPLIKPHDTKQAAKQYTSVYGELWYNYSKNADLNDVWELWIDEVKEKFNDQELHTIIDRGYNLKNSIPMTIDMPTNFDRTFFNPYHSTPPEGSYINLAHYYHNTYFSVVTETHYFNDMATHITEKTYKAILFKHPFVIASTPYFLQKLRNLGFKTFSPIIDESYDDEFDDTKRLKLIFQEIKRLCSLSESELTTFKNHCLDIVDYNFNLLAEKNTFIKSL